MKKGGHVEQIQLLDDMHGLEWCHAGLLPISIVLNNWLPEPRFIMGSRVKKPMSPSWDSAMGEDLLDQKHHALSPPCTAMLQWWSILGERKRLSDDLLFTFLHCLWIELYAIMGFPRSTCWKTPKRWDHFCCHDSNLMAHKSPNLLFHTELSIPPNAFQPELGKKKGKGQACFVFLPNLKSLCLVSSSLSLICNNLLALLTDTMATGPGVEMETLGALSCLFLSILATLNILTKMTSLLLRRREVWDISCFCREKSITQRTQGLLSDHRKEENTQWQSQSPQTWGSDAVTSCHTCDITSGFSRKGRQWW